MLPSMLFICAQNAMNVWKFRITWNCKYCNPTTRMRDLFVLFFWIGRECLFNSSWILWKRMKRRDTQRGREASTHGVSHTFMLLLRLSHESYKQNRVSVCAKKNENSINELKVMNHQGPVQHSIFIILYTQTSLFYRFSLFYSFTGCSLSFVCYSSKYLPMLVWMWLQCTCLFIIEFWR